MKLAVSSNKGIESKVGRIHGNGFIWREELLGQGETHLNVVS